MIGWFTYYVLEVRQDVNFYQWTLNGERCRITQGGYCEFGKYDLADQFTGFI